MSLKQQFNGYDPLVVGHHTAHHTTGAMSAGHGTADSPVTLFTVRGLVRIQMVAHVTTSATSTSNTGTLEVGFAGNTAILLPQDAVTATEFVAGDIWTEDVLPTTSIAQIGDAGNGLDWYALSETSSPIILTIATNNMTAGVIDFYCLWTPISPGGSVNAA